MAAPDPPARPKPLRRGEGPAIYVLVTREKKDVDGRDKRGMTARKCSDSAKPLSRLHFSTTDQLILTL
jgi:hypothetical protein